jgi:hypothetical protein
MDHNPITFEHNGKKVYRLLFCLLIGRGAGYLGKRASNSQVSTDFLETISLKICVICWQYLPDNQIFLAGSTYKKEVSLFSC